MTTWERPLDLADAARKVAAGARPVSGAVSLLSTAFPGTVGDWAVDVLEVLPAYVKPDRIGAGASLQSVADSPAVRAVAPAVSQAAAAIGTAPIRRQATMGGTVGLRALTSDMFAALAVHGAVVVVLRDGRQELTLEDYLHAGSGLIVEVRLTNLGPSAYRRFTATGGPGVPLASVAVGPRGAFAGAVGHDARPVPIPSRTQDKRSTNVQADVRADARASADYRAALVDVLLAEATADLDHAGHARGSAHSDPRTEKDRD